MSESDCDRQQQIFGEGLWFCDKVEPQRLIQSFFLYCPVATTPHGIIPSIFQRKHGRRHPRSSFPLLVAVIATSQFHLQ
jgi:hypothetical protein